MTEQSLRPEPAAPRPGDGGVVEVPGVPADFVGRERELAELLADIDRPGLGSGTPPAARVLLVAGRPGTGRTSLALRLAAEVADRYPDGRCFVRLTSAEGTPVPVEQVIRGLRRALGPGPAGRRLLLVLDDVVQAGQLAALLPDSAESLVVATSGGPLSGVPDVRPCTLGGLDTPAAVELLSAKVGATRVSCDPRGAETLVQDLAGHPTALHLTAAWLAARPGLSFADATARLRATPSAPFAPPHRRPEPMPRTAGVPLPAAAPAASRPDPRSAGVPRPVADPGAGGAAGLAAAAASTPHPGAAGLPRPAVVPGAGGAAVASGPAAGELVRAFRLVYGDLPGAAARMLRLLVLAPAGVVDAQGASALAGCAVEAAQATLEDFVRSGLLAGGAPQYRVPGCLEPMFAALLADAERPEDVRLARARMLERTVRLLLSCRAALAREAVEEGMPRALRFDTAQAAAGWLESRLPALLAAVRSAVADGELDTLARRLVAAMVRALAAFPGGDAMAAERYELHSLVLDVAERRGLPREQAAALINLGDLDAAAGRSDRALDRYRAALDAARACDDRQAEGRVLEALGGTYLERHDPARAFDWYGRALALRQAGGELADQARLHGRIGTLLALTGQYGQALRAWRTSAGLSKRLGDLPAQARALAEAARVQDAAGRPEDAVRSCRDALYWARQAGDRRLEAALLLRLADLLDRLGDPEGARLQREAANGLAGPGTPAG
ncbi:tetratricopeptide repeat protein [Actinacidiphila bryophytorum]|uniref:Tetratricopeptide repeat-containing protein n=1 Tax=Actinacidiphila bryophytorum TaxID=1436133 RepID=A0A9W4H7D1_9ACTN|nr:tetratricopeptide repeat protein [Actinacidiphila bryophytorum]CAG7657449.1 Tetratricopeptide repeat-containing protein [Actinacidiphila bryophytorum]